MLPSSLGTIPDESQVRGPHIALCGDFASHRFAVCALEHRDGRSSTFANVSSEETQPAPEKREGKKSQQRKYSRSDCIFPRGNVGDTRPSNEV